MMRKPANHEGENMGNPDFAILLNPTGFSVLTKLIVFAIRSLYIEKTQRNTENKYTHFTQCI